MLRYQSCHQQIKTLQYQEKKKKLIGVHVLMLHVDGRGMGESVCSQGYSEVIQNSAKGADKTLSLPYVTLLDTFALNY